MRDESRAVSDVLGFVAVFGVVVLSIALIYTFGTAALADLQHANAMDNAERAFDIVADNVEDVYRDDAPGRSTELQFAGGQVELSGTTTINVTDERTGNSTIVAATPLRYTSRETELTYAGGAVIRSDRGRAVMVNEPPFSFGERRVVVSLVETVTAGGSSSVGGTGSVLVSTRGEGSTLSQSRQDGSGTVTVTVTSPDYRAWARYFEQQPGTVTVDDANETVTYAQETDALYVRRTQVSVRPTS